MILWCFYPHRDLTVDIMLTLSKFSSEKLSDWEKIVSRTSEKVYWRESTSDKMLLFGQFCGHRDH